MQLLRQLVRTIASYRPNGSLRRQFINFFCNVFQQLQECARGWIIEFHRRDYVTPDVLLLPWHASSIAETLTISTAPDLCVGDATYHFIPFMAGRLVRNLLSDSSESSDACVGGLFCFFIDRHRGHVEVFHESSLPNLHSFGQMSLFLFVGARNVHAILFEHLQHFVSHCRDIGFHFVDVILGDGTVVEAAMHCRHITPYPRSNNVSVTMCAVIFAAL